MWYVRGSKSAEPGGNLLPRVGGERVRRRFGWEEEGGEKAWKVDVGVEFDEGGEEVEVEVEEEE